MGRSFSYIQCVRALIDNCDTPSSPSGMARAAMEDGAPHTGEDLHKKLWGACEMLASQNGYKRVRSKDVKGYLYCKSA